MEIKDLRRRGAAGIVFTGILLTAFVWKDDVHAAAGKEANDWQKGAGVAQWLDWPEEGQGDDDSQGADDSRDAAGGQDDQGSLVMADVKRVLNIREAPGEDEKLVGYLYADCGGRILERRDGWTKLTSGDLTGWAKDDYLLFGEQAQEAAKDAGRMVARTRTGALRIRKEPSLTAGVYDLLEKGAEYEVVDADQLAFSDGITLSEDWIAVDYGGKTGFVSAEFVELEFWVDNGETVERVKERKEEEERQKKEAEAAAKKEKRQAEIQKAQALATDDYTLLAALIQCEAGDEPYEGQVAVGAVVMNRVNSGAYPNTIRDVIFASGQFTPAGSGRLGKVLASGKIKESCKNAAAEAMAGASPVGGATHFRRAGGRDGLIIGHHVFW